MAEIKRSADAVWQGDLRGGSGKLTTPSGALKDSAYTWAARFENAQGTNPEELIAAAHAGCVTMAITSGLTKAGFPPESIHTHATLTMDRSESGTKLTVMRLEVEGRVPNMDAESFRKAVEEAEHGCPVSTLLRPGLKEIQVVTTLK